MIFEHGGIALNLFKLKAIKKEKDNRGGYLIFEFYDTLHDVEKTPNSDQWEDKPFAESPVSQYFDDFTDLQIHYEEWIGMWKQWKDYVIRGEEEEWRKKNGFDVEMWKMVKDEEKEWEKFEGSQDHSEE